MLDFLSGRAPRANPPRDPWPLLKRAFTGHIGPDRPRLAEATRVARDHRRDFWAALIEAGLVPADWATDRSRGFLTKVGLWAGRVVGPSAGRVVGPSSDAFIVELGELWRDIPASLIDPAVSLGDMVNESSGRFVPSVLDAPDDLHLAVALASDAGNVALAEALARESAERRRPWGGGEVSRLAWADVDRISLAGRTGPDLQKHALSRAPVSEADMERLNPWATAGSRLTRHVAEVARRHIAWCGAAGRRERVPEWAPPAVRGAAYHELPDPFEPQLELAALGYFTEVPLHGVLFVGVR